MTIIDLVKNEGDHGLLAWRFPNRQLAACAQLLVGEGEVAVLLRDRCVQRIYESGRYTLESEQLPLLRTLVRLPFGGKEPFEAEVWYIATRELPGVRWGIGGQATGLRGYGQLAVRVQEPALFLDAFCRNLLQFGTQELMAWLHAPLMQAVGDYTAGGLPAGGLEACATAVQQKLMPLFARYGLALTSLCVAQLETGAPASTPCTLCGKSINAQWRYCPHCGSPQGGRYGE